MASGAPAQRLIYVFSHPETRRRFSEQRPMDFVKAAFAITLDEPTGELGIPSEAERAYRIVEEGISGDRPLALYEETERREAAIDRPAAETMTAPGADPGCG